MPICACGNRDLAIVTSWSDRNPGRRFWSCLRNERRWFDESMCPRSVEVIPGLIRSMNKLQESLQQATLQARMYKLIILFSWGLFAIHYLKHGRRNCTMVYVMFVSFLSLTAVNYVLVNVVLML
uniref:Zinc finger GRF-type domain-containing protein n=1 Tax=Lactuca sativa TaxID=4236 RepID=A0A9R1VAL4_LACSA|nr:hypothetical protein LSAT_V11C600308800 [Lactuca sativa]